MCARDWILEQGDPGRCKGEQDELHADETDGGEGEVWATAWQAIQLECPLFEEEDQGCGDVEDGNVDPIRGLAEHTVPGIEEHRDQGHIPGAIVISHEELAEKAEEVLTDKDQLILVYCRSGRRSKLAAEALVELGYTNIKEFGGIIDWPYEVELS